MNSHRLKLQLTQIFVLFSAICFLSSAYYVEAENKIPHLINYQGKLTNRDGQPLEGAYNITFRIYAAQTAGDLLWEEIWNEQTQRVEIQKGVFSVLLGSVNDLNLAFDQEYWLAIEVDQDGEMAPRQQIAASGYAIRAEEVDSIPSGIIAMWSGTIADIPDGWALCDGTNGRPDLRDRFVVGAGDSYNPQDFGGSNTHDHTSWTHSHTLTIAQMPGHTHTESGHFDYGVSPGSDNTGGKTSTNTGSKGGGQGHRHGISNVNHLPLYYALAYIMKL